LKLIDIIRRQSVPKPWDEGEKIPWNDPDFSRRMLNEHLSQEHDAASRRFEIIDKHVKWIHNQVLKGNPTRILDLGCGPGLYTNRLARLGHRCVGIDFSPASIAYAREQAEEAGLECTYIHQDIRAADYGKEKGLFSEEPHLYLQENFWDTENNVAIQRYYVIDAATGEVARHSASTQAYTDEEYRSLLATCGFGKVVFYPSLGGSAGSPEGDLIGILSQKDEE